MKFFLKLLLLLTLVLTSFHIWTNWPVRLNVSTSEAIPSAPPSQKTVKMTVLSSGHIESIHAMNVRGGDWQPYNSGVIAVLLEHPRGRYLIDAGFGKDVQQHFLTTPALMQKVATLHAPSNTVAELEKHGLNAVDIDGILLTHAHWDHSSGLADLKSIPIHLPEAEIEFIHSDDEHVALISQWKDELDFQAVPFAQKPYRGFPQSHDLFNDGSVVLVAMSGHTPGSMGVFVTQPNGHSTFFVGDTSWTKEGVDWPAEKPYIAKRMVDANDQAVKALLIHLHKMQQQDPLLTIVPAHDQRQYSFIP